MYFFGLDEEETHFLSKLFPWKYLFLFLKYNHKLKIIHLIIEFTLEYISSSCIYKDKLFTNSKVIVRCHHQNSEPTSNKITLISISL